MSRDNWFSNARHSTVLPNSDQADAETLAFMQHKPLAHRTSDPEAADYDEAAELFVQGLRLARAGDLDAGRAQIATAYLLDGRSIKFVLAEPQNTQTRALCIDLFLLYNLSQATINDINSVSYGAHVMRVLIAEKLGNDPIEGQNFMAGGMVSINYLLQRVKEQPRLGAHYSQGGILGGCLTLTNLYYERSCLHMAMGNHKKAIADLTKALSIDPKYSRARDARSSLWASLRLQDEQTVFNEYKQLVSEAHPDQRGLDVAYAWMAYYTLRDAKCGTLAEAKSYYEKSLRASMRNLELYGAHPSGPPPIVKMVKEHYVLTMSHPENRQLREDMDVALATGRMEDLAIPEGFHVLPVDTIDKKMAHSCLTCGKSAVDKGMTALLKCTQCKQVSYCSKECQKTDWKKVRTSMFGTIDKLSIDCH